MLMTRDNPPIGGATLECLLGYRALGEADLADVVAVISASWRTVHVRGYFAADNSGEFFDLPDAKSATPAKFKFVGAELEGPLNDLVVRINVIVDPAKKVVSIGTREDFLWEGREVPQISRLLAFLSICRCVTSWRAPTTMVVGSEPASASELSVSDSSLERYRYTDSVWSRAAAEDLLHWYSEIYRKRW
jgi:hypothetical protein